MTRTSSEEDLIAVADEPSSSGEEGHGHGAPGHSDEDHHQDEPHVPQVRRHHCFFGCIVATSSVADSGFFGWSRSRFEGLAPSWINRNKFLTLFFLTLIKGKLKNKFFVIFLYSIWTYIYLEQFLFDFRTIRRRFGSLNQ